jgi:RNA polymerase sigma-70 factor (ECF subfamily)
MAPPSDPKLLVSLLDRCRHGDGDAFQRIFDMFRGPIYSYLARTTGDRHLAEDLLQDTFLRMIQNLDRYEESGRFQAWLFRIAANRVRDWARRKSHSERVGGAADPDDPDSTGTVDRPVDVPPETRMEQSEEIRLLEGAVAGLEYDERQVLILRHYSDLSFKEIADIMNAPLGTVLARSHRALAKLRERMAEASDG